MSAQKLLVLVSFLVAVTAVTAFYPGHYEEYASNKNQSHHLLVGTRAPGDRLVYREIIQKNSSFMQIVSVTKTFNTTYNSYITQAAAFDQKTNGKGAYASLLQGGPGHKNVTFKFKSQRGHGIHFVVELYAR